MAEKRPHRGVGAAVPAIGGPHDPVWQSNPVKEKLSQGNVVVAGTITNGCVDSAVVMASAFDALWIEGEHSAVTLESTRNIILATRGMRAVPLVRVPWQEAWMAKRVMDVGSLGVIFPFCSTVERAKQASRACRYPPLGCRGCGPTLAQLAWGLDESTYYTWSNENMLCIVIIEEGSAVDVVDEIAQIPHIDLLFIGTSDLSFSITGDKRNVQTPAVQAAISKVLAAGLKNNVPVGCPAGSAEQIKRLVGQGFRFFQAQPEIKFLQQAVTEFAASIDEAELSEASGCGVPSSVPKRAKLNGTEVEQQVC